MRHRPKHKTRFAKKWDDTLKTMKEQCYRRAGFHHRGYCYFFQNGKFHKKVKLRMVIN